jgi:hypothetical protein
MDSGYIKFRQGFFSQANGDFNKEQLLNMDAESCIRNTKHIIDNSSIVNNEIKYSILCQIRGISMIEGKNSFDTKEFEFIDNLMYQQIIYGSIDREQLKNFFENKGFKVSEWNWNNLCPTISW